MLNIQRLSSITELAAGQWCDGGRAAEEYAAKLADFTDSFPAKEEALRDAVAEGSLRDAASCVKTIHDMLAGINAEKLAADCAEKIAELPGMTESGLEAYAINLLGAVSSLSIDIQMALYSQEETADASRPGGSEPALTDGGGDSGAVILAVDDNSFFLSTIKSYLQSTPYKLTCVTSGSVALRFLEKHTPDLFILDIDMPEMDGYELAGEIRKRGKTSPIIFLTGNASKDYVIKAVRAGASDFIVKPISKDKALAKIAKYLS